MPYEGQLKNNINKLKSISIDQGRQNLPSTNATFPDQYEISVESDAKESVLKEKAHYINLCNEYKKQVDDINQKISELEVSCNNSFSEIDLESQVSQILVSEKPELVRKKVIELELLSNLKAFKEINGLSRRANDPKDSIYHFSVIFVFIAIETIINSFFFENQRGLVGGAVVALAISVVNISLACLLGYLFIHKNHNNLIVKIYGWTCIIIFFLMTIYLNSIFSTFRAEYQLITDPSDFRQTAAAFRIALSNASSIFLFSIPFLDILSFILFFVGCLLCIFAFYKGYSFDDPYPGYGAINKRYLSAESTFIEANNSARNKVSSFIDRHMSDLVKIKTSFAELVSLIGRLKGKISDVFQSYKMNLSIIQGDFEFVINTYRRINESVRATPTPSYFSQLPILINEPEEDLSPFCKLDAAREEVKATGDKYLLIIQRKMNAFSAVKVKYIGVEYDNYISDINVGAMRYISDKQQVLTV